MTLAYAYILTQYRNVLSYRLKDHDKCFVSSLHIRIDMTSIDIHRKLLSDGRWKKTKQLQLTENCIPKFDFC